MENGIGSSVVRPFKNISCDIKCHTLYKILQECKVGQCALLMSAKLILTFIDNNQIEFVNKDIKKFAELVASTSAINVSNNEALVITYFLLDEGLIQEEEDYFILSPYGRLFLISDNISSTIDMIRYYWEKADWELLAGSTDCYRFLSKDARRYVACLLHQFDGQFVDIDEIKKKYSHIEIIDFNNYHITYDMINNHYIMYIIKNIFEPMGFLKVKYDNAKSRYDLNLSNLGKRIFEFYSYNMREEYANLLEEAWECYDRENFEQSFSIAQDVIKVAYNIPEIYNLIGCVYIKMKKYAFAMDIFKLAIDICDGSTINLSKHREFSVDDYVSLYYNLGLCHYYIGDYINALHVFNDVKKTVPYTLDNIEDIIDTIKKIILIRPVQP